MIAGHRLDWLRVVSTYDKPHAARVELAGYLRSIAGTDQYLVGLSDDLILDCSDLRKVDHAQVSN